MKNILHHIVKTPVVQQENPALLLMLHGYGSDENDLFSFAAELPGELLIISARAPIRLSFGGFAWYPLYFEPDRNKHTDIPQAIKAHDLIKKFIDQLQNIYHFNPQKSFLMGFSQGSILSYALALNYPESIYNIIAMSGYIQIELLKQTFLKKDYNNLSFFCSHGKEDPVISIDLARNSIELLKKYNIDTTYKEYNSGHNINPENFKDMIGWIVKTLTK